MKTRRDIFRAAAALAAGGIAGQFAGARPTFARTPQDVPVPAPDVTGRINVRGGRVWYRINGAKHLGGKRVPLLGLHGGPGGHHGSMVSLIALAQDRAVILYDQLDCGYSDRPNDLKNWTVERFVSEIDSVRNALGLAKVAVLGHSMGGGWAAAYAANRPPGLAALVLASPLISTKRWIADNNAYIDRLPPRLRDALKNGDENSPDFQEAEREFYERHMCHNPCKGPDLGADGPTGNDDLYRYMWGPTEFRATGTLKNFDLTPHLGRISAPTLYMCGDQDEATPAACRDFSAMTPGSRFELIENSGHATLTEQSEDFLTTLNGFLLTVGA